MAVTINGTTGIVTPEPDGDISTGGDLSYTGTLTGSTGEINIGSGQIFKDESGNVGIGTNSPRNVTGFTGLILDSPTNGGFLDINRNGDRRLTLFSDATRAVVSSAPNINIGFDIGSAERMRIDSAGNVLVGQSATTIPGAGNTTTGVGIRNLGDAFFSRESTHAVSVNTNVNGQVIRMQRSGAAVGSISVTTTATAYNTSSDYRLKENVTSIEDAIDRVKQIPVHRFNFKADPNTTVDGFLAHEVQEFVPEAVTGEKDAVDDEGNPEYQGIDQSKIVPLLTAALQEAIAEIGSLKARIEVLEQA